MTIHNVAPGDFVTTYQSAGVVNGDTIRVQTSGVRQNITLPLGWQWGKQVTIEADQRGAYVPDPLGDGAGTFASRFERLVHFHGYGWMNASGGAITFVDTAHTFDGSYMPDWIGAGETWVSKGATFDANTAEALAVFQGNVGNCGIVLSGAEIYGGINAAHDPFVVGEKLPDFDGPTTYYPGSSVVDGTYSTTPGSGYSSTAFTQPGHGDASPRNSRSGILYNKFSLAPGAMRGRIAWVEAEDIYLHDLIGVRGLSPTVNSGGHVLIKRPWIERYYSDAIQLSLPQNNPNGSIRIDGYVIKDPIGHHNDLGNPHCDVIQIFGGTAATVAALHGVEINNGIAIASSGTREIGQALFEIIDDASSRAFAVGLKVRNQLILGANKGVALTPTQGSYVRNVISVNPKWLPSGIGTHPAYILTSRRNGANSAPPSVQYIKDSVCEGITVDGPLSGGNNISIGNKSASQSTLFIEGDVEPTTLHQAYENYKLVTGDQGPEYPNLRTMLTTESFTGEPIFAQAPPVIGAGLSALTTSELTYVHGGDNGDTHAITVGAGLEWRQVDLDGTTATSWTSGTASVTVGKYLQLRMTAAASESTTSQLEYSVGGATFTWSVTTVTSNRFPSTSQTAVRLLKATPGLTGTSDGKLLSGVMMFRPSDIAGNQRLFATTSDRCALSINGGAWYFTFRNGSAGNIIATTASGANAFANDTDYVIAFAIDLTKTTIADGFRIFRNGTEFTGYTSPIFSPSTGDIRINSDTWAFLNNTANSAPFKGHLYLAALWDGYVDWAAHLEKITLVNPDLIGPRGMGIPVGRYVDGLMTYTDEPAKVFIPGRADMMTAGTVNQGTGGAFALTGTPTQVDDEPWPPVLSLVAEEQPSAHETGKPVDALVYATGSPKALVLTPSASLAGTFEDSPIALDENSGGSLIRFTPSEPGELTLSFANDGGYANPASLVATIEEAETEPLDPPTSTTIPSQSATVGSSFSLALGAYFSDPSGEAGSYSVTGGPSSYALSSGSDVEAATWGGVATVAGSYPSVTIRYTRTVDGAYTEQVVSLNVGVISNTPSVLSSLFASGEKGLLWCLNGLEGLYQTSTTATPVTAVDQTVGLVLDRSPNGINAVQATDTKRPLLKRDAGGRYWIDWDGVNDALVTDTLTYDTPAFSYFLIAEAQSDSATGVALESTINSSTVAGSWAMFTPSSGQNILHRSRGTLPADVTSSRDPAPDRMSLIGHGHRNNDLSYLMIDGAVVGTTNTDQGNLGNFTAAPLHIGGRGGTSLFADMAIHTLVVVNREFTAGEKTALQAYANSVLNPSTSTGSKVYGGNTLGPRLGLAFR